MYARGLAFAGRCWCCSPPCGIRLGRSPDRGPADAGELAVLRIAPIRLSKYSYLTQSGLPPSSPPHGAGLRGRAEPVPGRLPPPMFGWLRKPMRAGAVNAGREALSFAVAFGITPLAVKLAGPRPSPSTFSRPSCAGRILLRGDPGAVLPLPHHAGKLEVEGRLFHSPWKIIAFLMTLLASGILVWAADTSCPRPGGRWWCWRSGVGDW